VAFNAANVIVGWSKTILDSFAFGENEFVVLKPAIAAGGWRDGFVYAFDDWRAFDTETVKEVIGLGVHVGRECFSRGLTFDWLRRAQR
jgi:hypothetical protein